MTRLRDAVRQAAPTTGRTPADAEVPPAPAVAFDGLRRRRRAAGRRRGSRAVRRGGRGPRRAEAGGAGGDRCAQGRTEFTSIGDPIKERLTGDDPAHLASLAGARAGELRARRRQILGMLADIHRDQGLVVTQVAALVNDVLTTLSAA